MSTAAKVAIEKREHPERFCIVKGCLWRRIHRDGRITPCRKHAADRVLARSIEPVR